MAQAGGGRLRRGRGLRESGPGRGGEKCASMHEPIMAPPRAGVYDPRMKTLLTALLLSAPLFAQGAPPQGGADQPYTLEYYYKVQWGKQQEFLRLFLKNHYPLLRKNVESGRMLSVKIETPANHMTEESRWDYRVTIRFRNSTLATTANPDEARLIRQLWPDQATYEKEEQRRFEILLSHWDLPVTDITPKK